MSQKQPSPVTEEVTHDGGLKKPRVLVLDADPHFMHGATSAKQDWAESGVDVYFREHKVQQGKASDKDHSPQAILDYMKKHEIDIVMIGDRDDFTTPYGAALSKELRQRGFRGQIGLMYETQNLTDKEKAAAEEVGAVAYPKRHIFGNVLPELKAAAANQKGDIYLS